MLVVQIALGIVLGAFLMRLLNRMGSPSVAAKSAVEKTGNVLWRLYRWCCIGVFAVLAIAFVVGIFQGIVERVQKKEAPTVPTPVEAPH